MTYLVLYYQIVKLMLMGKSESEEKGKLKIFSICLPEQTFRKLEDARENCLRSKFIGQLIERCLK